MAPRTPPVERVAQPAVGPQRSFTSASRAEVIGGVLLLVAAAFAVQALFDTTDGSNAFAEADGPPTSWRSC